MRVVEATQSMPDPTDRTVSGRLSDRDLKKLTRKTRSGGVGPTVVYYAGVTAPIISAAVAMMVASAAEMAGMSAYWQWMLSALVAACAGISWYLIFIRWSYRHTHGRGNELSEETNIVLLPKGLHVERDVISTLIGWSAVSNISVSRGDITVHVEGADPIIIPKKWFDGDKARRMRFIDALHDHME